MFSYDTCFHSTMSTTIPKGAFRIEADSTVRQSDPDFLQVVHLFRTFHSMFGSFECFENHRKRLGAVG